MKWIIKCKYYQPQEKYLYITSNKEWLLVREKGTIDITQAQYNLMVLKGMPDIFERVQDER